MTVGDIASGVITALFGMWMAWLGFHLRPTLSQQARSGWLLLGRHFLKLIGISFIALGIAMALHIVKSGRPVG